MADLLDLFNGEDEGVMAEAVPPPVSPTVARRRVRLALREAREAANLTQLEVAEEMEWSLSKVIRIENGDVSISPNDLRPLLSYLKIKDRAQISALIGDAKIARLRQHVAWWQDASFRDISPQLRQFFEYESVAVAVRTFNIRYFPGALQLPEYARALTGPFADEAQPFSGDPLSADRVEAVIEARRLRREAMLSRLGSMEYRTVLDQGVFLRSTGGPAVFVRQLREMQRLATEDLIRMRMLPFDLDVPIANNASFDLLSLGGVGPGNEVMYRENGITDEIIEDKNATSRHLQRFEQLWKVSLDEDETATFVGDRISYLENMISAGDDA
ncbi:helix-turn-helix transcriptional regulator [Actinoplanes sp. NPDC051470]|uniref:helix-turn-helix domain-containing protein n=1 Tax=Actinoplanes sp. NPDC051470 TaxID=3157224 RepID=UPI003427BF6D